MAYTQPYAYRGSHPLTGEPLGLPYRVIWLIRRGTEEQMFNHLDAALLVDAWPDVAPHLSPELRLLWDPLV